MGIAKVPANSQVGGETQLSNHKQNPPLLVEAGQVGNSGEQSEGGANSFPSTMGAQLRVRGVSQAAGA